ncbi:DUF2750 domain-containing protein [Alteromonas sp. CYL-A6]|uniref:DUF2750 domain-containing protein n=1 Tax=Alteromonas nitratireducens TaxID=3390813 RepID=UPI0034BF208D
MALQREEWLSASPMTRFDETVKAIRTGKTVWILNDEHGCVMLNADDDDGVPVWPSADIAALWATDEWAHCEPLAVSLDDWLKKWTPGMRQDELLVIVCPVPGEDGEVLEPDEFAHHLMGN